VDYYRKQMLLIIHPPAALSSPPPPSSPIASNNNPYAPSPRRVAVSFLKGQIEQLQSAAEDAQETANSLAQVVHAQEMEIAEWKQEKRRMCAKIARASSKRSMVSSPTGSPRENNKKRKKTVAYTNSKDNSFIYVVKCVCVMGMPAMWIWDAISAIQCAYIVYACIM
jgi:hypothetical protein